MRKAFVSVTIFLLSAGEALADPEQSYKGGKALSETLAGEKIYTADDRDLEQRTRDYVRDQGAGKETGFWDTKGPIQKGSAPTREGLKENEKGND